MITRRTKIQLMVFVLITLVGVSFVGAKYAQLGKLIVDSSYTVDAQFTDSGGIFSGAEVTYRGVTVGRVATMKLTSSGVDVALDIENSQNHIPANTKAVVGNRSAVGEQFVDLEPNVNTGPYLKNGSVIHQSETAIPITSSKWLSDTENLVQSVPKGSLKTVVSQFGAAFKDGGSDLSRLIDTSSSFIDSANRNFAITKKVISDSNIVLKTQLDKSSDIKTFAKNLALFSDTLAARDPDLRRIITSGSATAIQLRTFLEQNKVDLAKLLNNLVTTGQIQIKHLDGLRMVLILYPYTVAGGFVVNAKTPETGLYDAHFGMVLTQNGLCHHGYESTKQRPPQDGSNRPMNTKAHCAEPAATSNARGAQHAPRVAPSEGNSIGTYDLRTKKLTYTDGDPSTAVSYSAGADATFGKESWKWLLLQPLMPQD